MSPVHFAGDKKPKDRREWRLYLHLRLVAGTDARTARVLAGYLVGHEELPKQLLSFRFTTAAGETTPLPLLPSSRLYKAMILLRGGQLLAGHGAQFREFKGRYLLVFVDDARALDPKIRKSLPPDFRDADAVYSCARGVLRVLSIGGEPPRHHAPVTENQVPRTTHQDLSQEDKGKQVFAEMKLGELSELAASIGVAPPSVRGKTQGGPGGGLHPDPQGPTPGPTSLVNPNGSKRQMAAQIRRIFGKGAEVGPRGPCPRCGERMWGRSGEAGRCLSCDG